MSRTSPEQAPYEDVEARRDLQNVLEERDREWWADEDTAAVPDDAPDDKG